MPRRKAPALPPANATAEHLRWSVHWVVSRNGDYEIIEIDCEADLNEAIRIYSKAKSAGKKMATLRCRNVGFPPPDELQPHYETRRKTIGGKKKKVEVYVVPLKKLNRHGVMWCPYCREKRKYRHVGGPYPAMECPICGVTHRDFHVRKWNPIAARMFVAERS